MSEPKRIKRERTRGWRKPENAVIVSRPSRYGNPFTIAGAEEMGYDDPRAAVVGAFAEWLRGTRDMWQSDEGDRLRERILAGLPQLHGKDLACTCPLDIRCHADVLLEWTALSETELDERITRVRQRVERNRVWRGEDSLYGVEAAS
jgi:hypothetical protein